MTLVLWDADYLLLDPQDEDLRASATRAVSGYCVVRAGGKPQYVHRLVAERAYGQRLPDGAVVHHVNYQRNDNRHGNLVICQDSRFHKMLHARTDLLKVGGNPDKEKACCTCKQVLPKETFSPHRKTWDGRHQQCRACTNAARRGKGYGVWGPAKREYQNAYRARRRAERAAV